MNPFQFYQLLGTLVHSSFYSSIYCGQNAEHVVHVVGCSRKPVEISTIGCHVYQRRRYFRRAVLTNCDDVLHVESRVKSRCAYSCICAVPCFALHIGCL